MRLGSAECRGACRFRRVCAWTRLPLRRENSSSLAPKLRPPVARAGIVVRTALIARLTASDSPVVTLVAPPGYGKTTLLAQWVDASVRGWRGSRAKSPTTIPPRCGPPSPRRSTRSLRFRPAASQLLAAHGGGIGIVPAFVAAIEPIGPPMTIVLDHVEHVTSSESLAAIAEFAMRVPRGWQLALASREPLPIPTARLRAQGRITELGPAELAMSVDEAEALLAGADVVAPADHDRRAARPHRRLAGRAVSGRARDAGGHADRQTSPSEATIAGSASTCAPSCSLDHSRRGALPAADLRARPSLRTAVRCRGGRDRLGRHPRGSRRPQYARRPPRPPPRVVPLPPPPSRASAGRASDAESGRDRPSCTREPRRGTWPTACPKTPSSTRRRPEMRTWWPDSSWIS